MGLLISYFDWDSEIKWSQAEAVSLEILQLVGRRPEYFCYAKANGRPRIFRRSRILESDTDGYMACGVYDFEGGEVNLSQPCGVASYLRDQLGQTLYIFDEGRDAELERDLILSILLKVVEAAPGGVGFGCNLPRSKIPEAFVMGVHIASPTEDRAIGKWRIDRRDKVFERPSKLRDLFMLNIVSADMLERPTSSGDRLVDWIEQKADRGALVPLNLSNFAWFIDKSHISTVRREFSYTGMAY